MNVLVIPEHFSQDQYILKPIVKALLVKVGRSRASIQVCRNPLLGSVEQAMRWDRISEIINQYPYVDPFLLIVDRDGEEHRRLRLDNLENQATAILRQDQRFFAEHAWQEVEVWGLAGCTDLPRSWQWQAVRSERHPKENYFAPYARRRRLQDEPGGRRTTLGREAAGRYDRIRQLCPEIAELEGRIRIWIESARTL